MAEGQTFCIYCQREYASPRRLRTHIERKHPGTYAEANVNTHLAKSKEKA